MSRRVKILVSALVVVLLLTVGATATVMAQQDSTPTPQAEEAKGLLPRVAEILDIPQEEANEIKEWWEQKPEALDSVQGFNERCRVRLQKQEALRLAQSFKERCQLRLHKLAD